VTDKYGPIRVELRIEYPPTPDPYGIEIVELPILFLRDRISGNAELVAKVREYADQLEIAAGLDKG
jgi:hypothetical protein